MSIIEIDTAGIVRGLDTKCWQCGGRGDRPEHLDGRHWIGPDNGGASPNLCGICHGKGRLLTDAGIDLLAWMKRWL